MNNVNHAFCLQVKSKKMKQLFNHYRPDLRQREKIIYLLYK